MRTQFSKLFIFKAVSVASEHSQNALMPRHHFFLQDTLGEKHIHHFHFTHGKTNSLRTVNWKQSVS